VTWLSPRTGLPKGAPSGGIAKLANGKYRFKKPSCDGGCDANDNLLRIARTATTGSCPQGASFQAWSAPSADGDETQVTVGLVDPEDETTVELGLPLGWPVDPEGTSPQAATNEKGISLVVWQTRDPADTPKVLARPFDEHGAPLSKAVWLGADLAGPLLHPAVAALANGTFLVTYVAAPDKTESLQIHAEILDESVSTLSGPYAMLCSDGADFPLVTADPAGGAVISWDVPKRATIDAQRVDDESYPYGDQFEVASGDSISLTGLEITPEGEALAYWEGLDAATGESTGSSMAESFWGSSGTPIWLCR
jgi:hypothetical protein